MLLKIMYKKCLLYDAIFLNLYTEKKCTYSKMLTEVINRYCDFSLPSFLFVLSKYFMII